MPALFNSDSSPGMDLGLTLFLGRHLRGDDFYFAGAGAPAGICRASAGFPVSFASSSFASEAQGESGNSFTSASN